MNSGQSIAKNHIKVNAKALWMKNFQDSMSKMRFGSCNLIVLTVFDTYLRQMRL